jgi:hypothetical protein
VCCWPLSLVGVLVGLGGVLASGGGGLSELGRRVAGSGGGAGEWAGDLR